MHLCHTVSMPQRLCATQRPCHTGRRMSNGWKPQHHTAATARVPQGTMQTALHGAPVTPPCDRERRCFHSGPCQRWCPMHTHHAHACMLASCTRIMHKHHAHASCTRVYARIMHTHHAHVSEADSGGGGQDGSLICVGGAGGLSGDRSSCRWLGPALHVQVPGLGPALHVQVPLLLRR
jgi:hypothetical protein